MTSDCSAFSSGRASCCPSLFFVRLLRAQARPSSEVLLSSFWLCCCHHQPSLLSLSLLSLLLWLLLLLLSMPFCPCHGHRSSLIAVVNRTPLGIYGRLPWYDPCCGILNLCHSFLSAVSTCRSIAGLVVGILYTSSGYPLNHRSMIHRINVKYGVLVIVATGRTNRLSRWSVGCNSPCCVSVHRSLIAWRLTPVMFAPTLSLLFLFLTFRPTRRRFQTLCLVYKPGCTCQSVEPLRNAVSVARIQPQQVTPLSSQASHSSTLVGVMLVVAVDVIWLRSYG